MKKDKEGHYYPEKCEVCDVKFHEKSVWLVYSNANKTVCQKCYQMFLKKEMSHELTPKEKYRESVVKKKNNTSKSSFSQSNENEKNPFGIFLSASWIIAFLYSLMRFIMEQDNMDFILTLFFAWPAYFGFNILRSQFSNN